MSTRSILIAGNWKMNMGPNDTADFFEQLDAESQKQIDGVIAAVCPPFVSLATAFDSRKSASAVKIGAQNVHFEDNGAFTGEISTSMLTEVGCDYVILGHSERREYFGEDDAIINKKVKKALLAGITPIVCVGEVLDERKQNRHFDVVKTQTAGSLEGLSASELEKVVIAYEPVWAIGTGETASPEQAQEMHAFIRDELAKLFGKEAADTVLILYGGSMKPANAGELLQKPDVDGGLIGGASLKPADFAKLVAIAAEQK
ncbi:triose-phosphate isomerase [Natronogracilivirga saccharolytica]|uniref:Triosephosphate isomerase n=1 Tax=Natronogracilivirga saccharolytica TaxID=2812953 RepID=A0A8J7UUM4_9BACT|nr:triose-phosphate isomerase [Natronogracilivirga saccharolytica]MBP3192560.1 triose-phosphate isomerase [Natronogracilivirga saccharolytica]